MIRITIYSGPTKSDSNSGSISVRECDASRVGETLYNLGLEWKNADYMGQRQVVITLDPIPESEHNLEHIKRNVKASAMALERTGLT